MQNGTTFWPTGHTRRYNIPASIDMIDEKKKKFSDKSRKTVIGQALSYSTRKLPITGTFYVMKLNTFQTFYLLKDIAGVFIDFMKF